MQRAELVGMSATQSILLDGQEVEYRLVRSKSAKKLRVRIRPDGIEVVVPQSRDTQDAIAFVSQHRTWLIEQRKRAQHLRAVRRPYKRPHGQILLRGEPVSVNVVQLAPRHAPNRVSLEGGSISIVCGVHTQTPAERSLENWLRKQARESIARLVVEIGKQIKRLPNRVYVMGQRTKWGNCSALSNVSFNWRLIMSPDYVLRYIVTHEMVHLAIPDHSQRFWLTVQSLCPETNRARQWLVANQHRLMVNLSDLVSTAEA